MASMAQFTTKWNAFIDKIRPAVNTTGKVAQKTGKVLGFICKLLYGLRGVFLAIPVVIATLRLANYNAQNLPEQVGWNLLSTGEYAKLLERGTAVNGPVFLTFACLVLMLCSRRPLYPWLISIFTLALPLLLLATNNFDAFLLLFS